MKKTSITLILLVLLGSLFSVQVSPIQAQSVADFFLSLYNSSLTVQNVVEQESIDNMTVAYIANLSPQGFIALSVDTNIQPIIAFSFRSNFIFDNDPDNALYNMLLNDMTGRIDAMNSGTLPNVADHNILWTNYLNQNYTYFNQREEEYWPPAGTTSTGGWIETQWNQDTSPFNSFCPIDPETNTRSVTGCVATALSQVLNYHEYIGDRVWSDADDYISEGTIPNISIDDDYLAHYFPPFSEINTYLDDLRSHYSTGDITNTDISALCFVSGIACEMDYSSQGSGAHMGSSILIDKFNYYTADEISGAIPDMIISSLIPNMKNAQPAILALKNNAGTGHFVVCDGYWINDENEDFFHINYGWGGYQDSWYDLPDFSGSYDFFGNSILNIAPPGCHGILSGTVSLIGGDGQLSNVTIKAGNNTTYPDENGYYEIELYKGIYDVEAFHFGYGKLVTEVEIFANQNTNEIDFQMEASSPNYLYVPTTCTTIQNGIDTAQDGDIVIVLPGTYYENINFNGKRIIVASYYYLSQREDYINSTIINGGHNGRVVTFNHCEQFDSILSGFTITEGYLDPTNMYSHGSGIYCLYSSPTLRNLIITDNEAQHAAGIDMLCSNSSLANIRIFDNPQTGTSGAIRCTWSSNNTMKNVLIYNNDQKGLQISCNSVVTLQNATIWNNGLVGSTTCSNSELEMTNCLVWNNNNGGVQILKENNASLIINHSDIQGGLPTGATGHNNINTYPLLVDPANGDFQPKWTSTEFSPLIDAGDPSILDHDGTPSDIGAIQAIDHKVDSIDLIDMTEGINWKCFPVLDHVFTGNDIASSIFEEVQRMPPYPAALDLVEFQNFNNNIFYNNEFWLNNSHQFTSDSGCKIHMNDPYTIEITGFLEDPYHVIELELGDNWIGYYLEASMEPLEAFEAVLDDIDMIQTKTFTLNKTALGWLGASNWTLNYGDLVVVHCTSNCNFYWGQDGGGTVPIKSRDSATEFTYIEEANYLPIYVNLDNQKSGNPTEIGLFINGECKGAEVITDSLVQIRAYVLNDTTTFDPAEVELHLAYGSRAQSITIEDFKIKHAITDGWESRHEYTDKNLHNYYMISLTDSENGTPVVNRTSLSQNYPNPFNPTTTISYSLAQPGNVELAVYNIKGQKVKTLVCEKKEAGQHQVIWDGTNNSHSTVSSGIYFYRLASGKKILNKKMLLLK